MSRVRQERCLVMLYFFHIKDEGDTIHDTEGRDFADLTAARAEAIESARELMSQRLLNEGRLGAGRVFEITDERGCTVLTVPFQDALN